MHWWSWGAWYNTCELLCSTHLQTAGFREDPGGLISLPENSYSFFSIGFGKKNKRSELSATPSLNQHLSYCCWELMLWQVIARSVNAKMKAIEPLEGKAKRIKLEVAAWYDVVGGELWKETLRFALPWLEGFELFLPPFSRLAVSVIGLLSFEG